MLGVAIRGVLPRPSAQPVSSACFPHTGRCAKLASPWVSEALGTLIALLDGALIEGSGMPEYRRPE
jgi:hypothetical protein